VDFRTTAWMTADNVKPRISAQVISQVIDPVIDRACKMACVWFTSLGLTAHVMSARGAAMSQAPPVGRPTLAPQRAHSTEAAATAGVIPSGRGGYQYWLLVDRATRRGRWAGRGASLAFTGAATVLT
jgi:hypothetical protein